MHKHSCTTLYIPFFLQNTEKNEYLKKTQKLLLYSPLIERTLHLKRLIYKQIYFLEERAKTAILIYME